MWRTLWIGIIGTLALNYTPSAPEIFSRMNATLRKPKPVQLRVIREGPHGGILEEKDLTIPAPASSTDNSHSVIDLPYAVLTLPLERLANILPELQSDNAKVSLGRLNGTICYVLEGGNERIWISKENLLPLKMEFPPGRHLGTVYLFTGMVRLKGGVHYPSRTEVWRSGELVLVERLATGPVSASGP